MPVQLKDPWAAAPGGPSDEDIKLKLHSFRDWLKDLGTAQKSADAVHERILQQLATKVKFELIDDRGPNYKWRIWTAPNRPPKDAGEYDNIAFRRIYIASHAGIDLTTASKYAKLLVYDIINDDWAIDASKGVKKNLDSLKAHMALKAGGDGEGGAADAAGGGGAKVRGSPTDGRGPDAHSNGRTNPSRRLRRRPFV